MSSELINRISIKRDRVYISTHSSNDTSPFYSTEYLPLTKAYQSGGQKELDKVVIDMCLSYCRLKGNHKSILPYKEAIEKAIYDKDFKNIEIEYRKLDDKAFNIANRFDEYNHLTKTESEKMYKEIEPELKRLRNLRNEYIANIVEKERRKINGPKELADGIYEVIADHIIHKKMANYIKSI